MHHSLAQSEALLLAHAEAAVHGTRLCLLVGVVVGFWSRFASCLVPWRTFLQGIQSDSVHAGS
jgi:hypothetical protein